MNLIEQLRQARSKQFVALILDNEVTVGEFVTEPPLPWSRIVRSAGGFQIADGYPTLLTAAQARFEMKNWDQVSLPALEETLDEIAEAVDYIVIGNNAGQGLPLAQSVTRASRNRAAIIYAASLPEQRAYEQLGYRTCFRRPETPARLGALAQAAERPLALYFINTIQHNERNYHDP
jgi:hypothetical protein